MTENTILSNELDLPQLPINAQAFQIRKTVINTFIDTQVAERERLYLSTVELKNWLERYPVLSKFLLDLLENLQRPHIDFFNKLFTALKHDVLYSEMDKEDLPEKANKVLFQSSFRTDKMALKIMAQTPNGDLETITSGGEKNVIATGLRLLALWRIIASEKKQINRSHFRHRNFAFLDEPDCWISQKALPHYVNLLNQIVHNFEQQVLMVTHHDVSLFAPFARVYRITHNGSFSSIQLVSEPSSFSNQEFPVRHTYLKRIELRNFKTFKSLDIELSPYFTVFVGESMAGKSAIMEAFNAIVNNDADDTVIRHHEGKASVSLTMLNDEPNGEIKEYTLLWERTRKTTPQFPQKVRYRLFEQGNTTPIHEEYNSNHTPEFAENTLRMRKVDGIDIHLGSQENMNFLFSSNINDFERAKILSLGKESAYINKMIDKLTKMKREKTSEAKMLENRYKALKLLLEDSALPIETGIDPQDTQYKQLLNYEQQLQKDNMTMVKVHDLLNKWETLAHIHLLSSDSTSHHDFMYLTPLQNISKEMMSRKTNLNNMAVYLQQLTQYENATQLIDDNQPLTNNTIMDLENCHQALHKRYDDLKNVGVLLKQYLAVERANKQSNVLDTLIAKQKHQMLSGLHAELVQNQQSLQVLQRYLNELETLNQTQDIVVQQTKSFNNIGLLSIVQDKLKQVDLPSLIQTGKSLSELEKEVIRANKHQETMTALVSILTQWQAQLLNAMPICPTCGHAIECHKHEH